jgi:hypothetical protein
LNFHEIVARIDLQHYNRLGYRLLDLVFEYFRPSAISRIVELFPNQIANGPDELLVLAAKRGAIGVVKTLLMRGVSVDTKNFGYGDGETALYAAVWSFHDAVLDYQMDAAEAGGPEQIIRVLVAIGADVFVCDRGGTSIMHLAAETGELSLIRLFLRPAVQLEEKGLHGSVQRLIRARDREDKVPSDYADTDVAELLEKELSDAVLRDGGVMYDFDTDPIREMRAHRKDFDLDFIREMRARHDNVVASDGLSFDSDDSENSHNSEELENSRSEAFDLELRRWIGLRRQELEQDYKTQERSLGIANDESQLKKSASYLAEVAVVLSTFAFENAQT